MKDMNYTYLEATLLQLFARRKQVTAVEELLKKEKNTINARIAHIQKLVEKEK